MINYIVQLYYFTIIYIVFNYIDTPTGSNGDYNKYTQELGLKMHITIQYTPIGIIHSPFKKLDNMPIQPKGAQGAVGKIKMFEEYVAALKDLDGFSHIQLLYHFHRSREWKCEVIPFLDTVPHGLFATRAPKRPNPIGLSVVKLLKIKGRYLHIEGIDVLNSTPLLDIKPYIPIFDQPEKVRIGWLEGNDEGVANQRSDNRFIDD